MTRVIFLLASSHQPALNWCRAIFFPFSPFTHPSFTPSFLPLPSPLFKSTELKFFKAASKQSTLNVPQCSQMASMSARLHLPQARRPLPQLCKYSSSLLPGLSSLAHGGRWSRVEKVEEGGAPSSNVQQWYEIYFYQPLVLYLIFIFSEPTVLARTPKPPTLPPPSYHLRTLSYTVFLYISLIRHSIIQVF